MSTRRLPHLQLLTEGSVRLGDGPEGTECAPPSTQPHLVFQLPQLAWSIGWENWQDAESALPG